jgi:enediyne biosynthesis protein E4
MPAGIAVAVLALLAESSSPFEDRSAGSGITMVLKNGVTPEKHQIETMPGGAAMFDYDNDGLPDLYFANGARSPGLDRPDETWNNRLYRNRGNWTFEDVTEVSGTAGSGYTFGVAAADFDNDGHTDLFVTGMPRSFLYRNRGDGTFEDVTEPAGVTNRQQWPIAAGWFDYDRDGRLDLFVVNYVRWNPASEPFCGDSVARKYRTWCHPKYYTGLPNTLFRNEGGGRFRDVSSETGVIEHTGKGMGAAFADYDSDGDTDIFVTNDTVRNFLFRNDGSRFTEVGSEAGVAYNDDGRALSSMGVDFRDADNDGREDVFVTALANEGYPLYRNLGKGVFLDATYPSRLGAATLPLSGWSNAIVDFDNDGWKDLLAANGDVQDNTEVFSSRSSRQQNVLLLNDRKGTFRPVLFGTAALHRGAAFGDLDNDGRIDAVVTRLGQTPAVLRNNLARGNWIGFRLRGTKSNRSAIGAVVRITAGGVTQTNHVTSAVGYASSSELRVHFGTGGTAGIDQAEVRWPSGSVTKLGIMKGNRYVDVTEE